LALRGTSAAPSAQGYHASAARGATADARAAVVDARVSDAPTGLRLTDLAARRYHRGRL